MSRLALACAALAIVPPALGITLVAGIAAVGSGTPCGLAGPSQVVAGRALDAEQLANAQAIITTTARRGMPDRAAVVAVATALQESSLRNVPHGDRDSLGLFQQRDSWGSASTRLDPAAATTLFLDELDKIPGWQQLPTTVASDRVQRSAYPWAVAKWEATAAELVARSWHQPRSVRASLHGSSPADADPAGSNCPGQGGEDGPLTGRTAVPTGYTPPSAGTQGAVTRFALDQLGEPYVWGATGPDSWDCSGLAMRAWAAAGVALPRTTFQQVLAGAPVPSIAHLQPGDLIFIAGSDGTATAPGHMGLYLGRVAGTPSLIHAPRAGKNVEIKALSAWAGGIVAIRRPTPPTKSS